MAVGLQRLDIHLKFMKRHVIWQVVFMCHVSKHPSLAKFFSIFLQVNLKGAVQRRHPHSLLDLECFLQRRKLRCTPALKDFCMLQQTISFSSTVQIALKVEKKLQISWYDFTLTSAKPGILTEVCRLFISTVVYEKVGKRPPLHIRQPSPFN